MMAGFGADNPMPTVQYDEAWFEGKKVQLGTSITNDIPNRTCYKCHSKRPVGSDAPPRWHRQQDVHMAQGMSCTDCHRNAIDHMTTRNYENDPALDEPAVQTLSCKGCHLGSDQHDGASLVSAGGRMASPHPEHAGIPPLHFEEMTCTSCHSGPSNQQVTERVQTSVAHRLGESSEYRNDRTLPHIVSPVFLENDHGRLAPHRAVWPAYWGIERSPRDGDAAADAERSGAATQPASDENAGIAPLPVEPVAEALDGVLPAPEHDGIWRSLKRPQIAEGLAALSEADTDWSEGELVYVSGGKVYRRAEAGDGDDAEGDDAANGEADDGAEGEAGSNSEEDAKLVVDSDHPAAEPYTWALAHDVRPAGQSLGAKSCKECHSPASTVDFSMTAAANWQQVESEAPTLPRKSMRAMRDDSLIELSVWNLLFQGRTLFKGLAIVSTLIVALVLLAYGSSTLRGALASARSGERSDGS
jgi:hypothetical protein